MHESEGMRMSRGQKRRYRRDRGQAMLRRLLLFLTAMVVLAGVASHFACAHRHAGDRRL